MLYAWMPASSQDEMIYILMFPKKGPKKNRWNKTQQDPAEVN
jgi:hypothetical protein